MSSLLSGVTGLAISAASAVSAAVAVAVVPLIAAPAAAVGQGHEHRGDHLTVVVRHAGAGRDGTHELFCHPSGGHHPNAEQACQKLDAQTQWGRDLFAPVPPGSICSMISGGPATARVIGTWAGRPVDASYDRHNGCEIERWKRMVPLLPEIG
ncbi:SSI family serine proteinase inhibitor [Streptomyces sp. NPDC048106]|uniref:SSI family serine proteinase inhibitor n=1 Tax=Streptomyces sp. NPDC048106 TaxID=3155750 RepID=UPI0034516BEC